MSTIKLTTKQLEIFNKYQKEKQNLQNQFQKVINLENDFVVTVFESAGEQIVEGIKFDGEGFVIPDSTVKSEKIKEKTKK